MGVNIKIPYLEANGESSISAFSKIHSIAKIVTGYLISQKGDFVVDDPVSFMLKLGNNFLNVADTFLNIAKAGKDSNSAYALFRVQADYLATIIFIFDGKSEEETKFRYLLYLIDGISKRNDSLKEIPKYNGEISLEDYEALVKQMTHAKDNAQEMLDFCYKELEKHPYKQSNPTLFTKIVKNKQWRYKEFNDTLKKYDFFNWQELYNYIDSRPDIASFISLCSHYVHGSVNSLLSDVGDDVFDPIVSCDTLLIERYIELLETLYGKDEIHKIIKYCLLGVTIKIC